MGLTFLSKNELAVKDNSHVSYLFQYKGRLLFSFYVCLRGHKAAEFSMAPNLIMLSGYPKLRSVDTRVLVKTLQSNGIRVLGSSIIGLEHHSPENIRQIIDYAICHGTDFHQFMVYAPSS